VSRSIRIKSQEEKNEWGVSRPNSDRGEGVIEEEVGVIERDLGDIWRGGLEGDATSELAEGVREGIV